MEKGTKIFGAILIVVILVASVYFMIPGKVRVDITKTNTRYSVWENNSWTLTATEYVDLYDGTVKMRASSRELITWNDSTQVYTKRISKWKDNITTIQTYTFSAVSGDIEKFPLKNEFQCLNCQGKIINYEFRDILYFGDTREISSPFNFGHNMKLEWQDGSYYSKVFQQKSSDKIIIKYKPQNYDEVYDVRLFDPPSTTNLTFDGADSDKDVEIGSVITLNGTSTPNTLTVCLSADHPDLGTNFACGTGSIEYDWPSISGINKFNDSSKAQTISFNWTGYTSDRMSNISYLANVRNNSEFERSFIDVVGINISGQIRANPYSWECRDSSEVITEETEYSPGHEYCKMSGDGDNLTYVAGTGNFSYIYAIMNISVTPGLSNYTWHRIYLAEKTYSDNAACYNWTSSAWISKNIVFGGDYSSKDYPVTLPTSCVDAIGNAKIRIKSTHYNSTRYDYPLDTYISYEGNGYPKNIKIDTNGGNTSEWGMSGELRNKTAMILEFNDYVHIGSQAYDEPGTTVQYIRIPKDYNLTNATMKITPARTITVPWSTGGNIISEDLFIYPEGAHRDGTQEFYLFGGSIAHLDEAGNIESISDTNRSYKWIIKTDNVTQMASASDEIGPGPCVIYWNQSTGLGQGFYVFGGTRANETYHTNTFFYSAVGNNFTTRAALPTARAFMACHEYGDGIYLFGGLGGYGLSQNNTWFYNVSSNAFTVKTDLPWTESMGHVELYSSDTLLFWGSTAYSEFYNVTNNSFITEELYGCADLGSGAKINDFIYCFAGYGTDQYSDDIEVLQGSTQFYKVYGEQYTKLMLYPSCEEVDGRVVCLWGGTPTSYGFNYQEIYFNPADISLTIGTQSSPSWNHSGIMTVAENVTSLQTDINEELNLCTEDAEGYCNIPFYFTNAKTGYLFASNLNLTYTIGRADIRLNRTTCASDYCNVVLNVSSTSTGKVNISNINITYYGTSNLTINASTTGNASYDPSSETHVLNLYYSVWDYVLPANINYIEFIPSRPTSKNVTPYGQTSTKPILNITLGNNDKNASWFALLNETHSCVNLSFSPNSTSKTLMTNNTWIEFMNNKGDYSSQGIFMWADYECNYTSWKLWEPEYFFKACCEDCICDDEVT